MDTPELVKPHGLKEAKLVLARALVELTWEDGDPPLIFDIEYGGPQWHVEVRKHSEDDPLVEDYTEQLPNKPVDQNFVTSEPMNEFEADIWTAFETRGLKLVPQVGCSQFRIDFGVCHPQQPGRFVMAIECDGATYHSSATARDRDRLRQ